MYSIVKSVRLQQKVESRGPHVVAVVQLHSKSCVPTEHWFLLLLPRFLKGMGHLMEILTDTETTRARRAPFLLAHGR